MKVDTRAGSKDLISPLRASGVSVEEATLPAGDVEILGCGPEGRPVLVGIEYKSVEDALACMRNGRFAEQLRGMRESFEVRWLLVEGRWRQRAALEVWNGWKWFEIPGHFSEPELWGWLLTMAQCGGALIWHTEDKNQTVTWLKALEHWWTDKDYEDHRAHHAIYTPPTEGNPFEEPTLAHRVAMVLPGLGGIRAEKVAKHFGSVERMVNATALEWMEVEGIGKGISEKLVSRLRDKA